MNDDPLSLLLISEDESVETKLGYAFQVVLEHRLRSVRTAEKASKLIEDGFAPAVVLLFVTSVSDQLLSYIPEVKEKMSGPQPTVIVLHPEEVYAAATAFAAGADDVVSWPLDLQDLSARVAVRLGQNPQEGWLLDDMGFWETEEFIARRSSFTTVEQKIFRLLYYSFGEIVSRETLSEVVTGQPYNYGDRKFDVHIAKVRRKLADAFGDRFKVTTVRSIGYRLTGSL